MEATALHNFDASNGDELSFRRGEIVKILSEGDKIWFSAELNGRDGLVPANYVEFNPPVWFMTVSKDEAVRVLNSKKSSGDGTFLVRPSESTPGELSLSVRIRDIQHFKILRTPKRDGYYLWSNSPEFKSINELVEHYKQYTVSNKEHVLLKDSQLSKVIASYDFESRSPEELSIYRGDVITVLEKVDADWWKGHVERHGKQVRGLFPANYVTAYCD